MPMPRLFNMPSPVPRRRLPVVSVLSGRQLAPALVAVLALAALAALTACGRGGGGEEEPAATATATQSPSPTPGSPAAGRIAFDSDRDGNAEVYVMHTDGSNLTNLTNNPAADGFPA